MQILQASDLEGGVVAIGRAANFAAIVDKLAQDAADDPDATTSSWTAPTTTSCSPEAVQNLIL